LRRRYGERTGKPLINRPFDVPEAVATLRDALTMATTIEEIGRLSDELREALRRWKNEVQ